MQIRLRTKLSLVFLLVMLLLVGSLGILVNNVLTVQFNQYAINKQKDKFTSLAELLSSRFSDWGKQWDLDGLESIGVNALSEGLLIRVKNLDNTVLWDARVHNNGMCTAILENIADRMQSHNSHFQGGYVEETFPVFAGNEQVGSVDIGYYGPYYYSDIDIQFLYTLNQLLWTAALISLFVSIALGILLARQLTRPITRVIETAQNIAGGKYIDRIHEQSNTKEIAELTAAINSLAETLGKQENLRKQLTSDVAHELRTPLTILQSHLEAMIDGTWPADQARLENCHVEVVRLSNLVDDLGKLTLLEQENRVLNVEPFDLAVLISRIAANFQKDFDSKQVRLILETPSEMIEADADKLSQVLINLLSNALKYTPAGGSVTIRTTADASDQTVAITVADSGIGIAPEDLPLIFERFYRTDKSRTRHTGGSGIGLTIVQSIVEAHQGKITVESQPGQGSRFIVTLPRKQAQKP